MKNKFQNLTDNFAARSSLSTELSYRNQQLSIQLACPFVNTKKLNEDSFYNLASKYAALSPTEKSEMTKVLLDSRRKVSKDSKDFILRTFDKTSKALQKREEDLVSRT